MQVIDELNSYSIILKFWVFIFILYKLWVLFCSTVYKMGNEQLLQHWEKLLLCLHLTIQFFIYVPFSSSYFVESGQNAPSVQIWFEKQAELGEWKWDALNDMGYNNVRHTNFLISIYVTVWGVIFWLIEYQILLFKW